MCFQKDGKTSQAARCIKSSIMTKVIYSVISIDTSEKKCDVLKGMSQSPRLKYPVHAIGIYQSLSNNAINEKKCLENIKNYTNKLLSVTIGKNSKIFLRLIWFLLQKDSRMTVLYLP